MRYLSLCSGIEAATLAWEPLGWEPVGFAEVEPFPSAVLKAHYPEVRNLGDITKIDGKTLRTLGHVDLIVAGTPCQDLSLAGKRKGLDGERSGLFHEMMRIFHAARNVCGTRLLLWENVCGAFSTNNGRDFAVVVGEMAGARFGVPEDGWKTSGAAVGRNGLLEWRVLDAQYVRVESHPRAVPQRRRRVFALLDTGDWRDRPPILLEREGVQGHSPPRREAGEAAPSLPSQSTEGGGPRGDFHYDGGLIAEPLSAMDTPTCAQSVDANHIVAFQSKASATQSMNPSEVAPSMDVGKCDGIAVAFAENERGEIRQSDVIQSMSSGGGKPRGDFHYDGGLIASKWPAEVSATLMKQTMGSDNQHINAGCPFFVPVAHSPGQGYPAIQSGMQIRRLTPRECERLMGMPDDYTLITYRGKPAADGNRYKALGNSMCVNVMRHIGDRLESLGSV